ncbi:MAG: SurA N-terminal domain-containing protein [Moraxellaceae bacterium]|nr:SurA N-terminal domain-containing protein [Moraxellaceae bacterium]
MDAFRNMIKGWLGKVLLVILIVPFAFVGLESYFGNSGRVVVAKVNGEEIYQARMDELVERQRQQLLAEAAQRGTAAPDIDMPALRKQVLDSLINRELVKQEGHRLGYRISEQEAYRRIREVPQFQENGAFSQAQYEAVLRQNGLNPATYHVELRNELAYAMLINGLGQSGFVTSAELGRLSALESQRRDIHFAVVPAARYLDKVSISDDDIKTHYNANPSLYTSSETVAIDYITLRREDFLARVEITEDDLQERYREKLSEIAADEQREAQHILLTVDDKNADADVLKKIKDIEKRARAGEDFGKLAGEFSQDPGSVGNAGKLGLASRGQFVAEFEKSLFSLKPGELSAPVKTEYGYHLIKLNRIEKSEAPAFAALKNTLEQEIRAIKADELFAEEIEKLDAATYESADLAEPARNFKRTIESLPAMTRSGAASGLAADRKIIETAFSDDIARDGKNSQGIRMDDGSMVWLRAREHKPSVVRPLAEVSVAARNRLLVERARALAKVDADAVIKAIAGGATLAEAAAKLDIKWIDIPGADRRTQMPVPDLLSTAFRLTRPAEGKLSADTVELETGYGMVAVSKVVEGDANAMATLQQMRAMLAEKRSEQEFQDYVRFLREEGKVKIYLSDVAKD